MRVGLLALAAHQVINHANLVRRHGQLGRGDAAFASDLVAARLQNARVAGELGELVDDIEDALPLE